MKIDSSGTSTENNDENRRGGRGKGKEKTRRDRKTLHGDPEWDGVGNTCSAYRVPVKMYVIYFVERAGNVYGVITIIIIIMPERICYFFEKGLT